MRVLRATQCSSVVLCGLVFAVGSAVSQINPSRAIRAAATPSSAAPVTFSPARVFPHLRLRGGLDLTYLGMYSPDAMFHATSKFTGLTGNVPGEDIVRALPPSQPAETAGAPGWMLLADERIVQDLEATEHAKAAGAIHSRPADVRDPFVTYAYGRPSVLRAPRYVVTDAQHRLILSDPDGLAVHVLDPAGKASFRLVCGQSYRVHRPAGVAVDAESNIYVADSEHGMVAVFDSSGNFLRYIGTVHGEPDYASPHGIAIDPTRRRLFLVDTPRNMVFELDLNGNVIKRLGKNRRGEGAGEYDSPTKIAVNHEHIFVLDRGGARIQVLSANFEPTRSFEVAQGVDPELYRENGLAADMEGHVLVSFYRGASVFVFSSDGQLVAAFGQPGIRAGQFAGPGGLWIDGQDHLFVADSDNGRVQMFQLKYVN